MGTTAAVGDPEDVTSVELAVEAELEKVDPAPAWPGELKFRSVTLLLLLLAVAAVTAVRTESMPVREVVPRAAAWGLDS